MKVVASPNADCEVDRIRREMADDNPKASELFIEAYRETMRWIGEFPKSSQVLFTSARGHEVRVRPIAGFPKLLAVYVITTNFVKIAHVVHGFSDWMRSISQAFRPKREGT